MICGKCSRSWEEQEGIIDTNCPFCQHVLVEDSNFSVDTPIGAIKSLVATKTNVIYNENTKFKALLNKRLSSNEKNKKILKMLRIIIDNDMAKNIYSFINLPDSEFDAKIRSMLFDISEDTFISQEVLSEGASLLCEGIGRKFDFILPSVVETQAEEDVKEVTQYEEDVKEVTQAEEDVKKVTQYEEDVKEVTQYEEDVKEVTQYEEDVKEVTQAEEDVKEVTQYEEDVKEVTQYEEDVKEVTQAEEDVKEVTQAEEDVKEVTQAEEDVKESPLKDFEIDREGVLTKYIGSDTDVVIPDLVTKIGGVVFCKSISSIKIPNSVTEIGWWAFDGCSSLLSIKIPNSVIVIGGSAFSGCSSLSLVTISNAVTVIGMNVFKNCSSLSTIEIPNSVEKIDEGAFKGCSSLSLVKIPNSVTEIVWSAFSGCNSLNDIHIQKGTDHSVLNQMKLERPMANIHWI